MALLFLPFLLLLLPQFELHLHRLARGQVHFFGVGRTRPTFPALLFGASERQRTVGKTALFGTSNLVAAKP
jgi:hypothetical protein